MNSYALYDPATEKVHAFIQCAPRNAELQARSGLAITEMVGGFPGKPDDFRVVDGEVVPK